MKKKDSREGRPDVRNTVILLCCDPAGYLRGVPSMQCCWTIVMLQKKKCSNHRYLCTYLSIIGNVSLLLYISCMYHVYLVAMWEVGRVNCKKRSGKAACVARSDEVEPSKKYHNHRRVKHCASHTYNHYTNTILKPLTNSFTCIDRNKRQ